MTDNRVKCHHTGIQFNFFLFPVSGIECPMCTNVPGLGAGKCDSGKVPTVNCSDGLDQCMSLKGKMMFPGFTQSIELKNCSNNVLCDSASDFNGKNSKEFPPSPPPPPPSPLPTLRRKLAYDHKRMLGVSLWRMNSDFCLGYTFEDVKAIFCSYRASVGYFIK